MIREPSPPRPDWEAKVEALGFDFHHLHGQVYWTEDVRYRFTSAL